MKMNLENDKTDAWMGGTRHRFQFKGREAWIVEPPAFEDWQDSSNWGPEMHSILNAPDYSQPAKWFWLPEWPTAFPERNGVKELLSLGYTMVHLHIFGSFANPENVEAMHDFYAYLQELGFASKGALIGMSLGGLYSFRFAATYPECVNCIYADAPVCSLSYRPDMKPDWRGKIQAAYGTEELENHPLAPLNNYLPMAQAKIPILLVLGNDDQVVPPEINGELLAKRYAEAGAPIEVLRRPSWGHHPHGLQNPMKIVRFILRYNK